MRGKDQAEVLLAPAEAGTGGRAMGQEAWLLCRRCGYDAGGKPMAETLVYMHGCHTEDVAMVGAGNGCFLRTVCGLFRRPDHGGYRSLFSKITA